MDVAQGEVLRKGRETARMTQSVLAQAAGLSEKSVRRAEAGKTVSTETVKAMCAVLGIDASRISHPRRERPPLDVDLVASQIMDDWWAKATPILAEFESFRFRSRLVVFGMAIALAAFGLVASTLREGYLAGRHQAVETLWSDSAYVGRARDAGYRLLATGDADGTVWAVCSRSDRSGPLPCDGLPQPDHGEIRVRLATK